ncbi:MAG: BrnT family toxin [Candidatus Omnitrophica bacterium]|nr:BrnT family toxin [Candidatus Omnitrophota bacterium]
MRELPTPFSFDWDKGNINKNWIKHKVHFKEAEEVFFNKPLKVFPDKSHSKKEKRLVILGTTNLRRNLTIIFTFRQNKIRVISARNQSKKERGEYEKNQK